MRTPNEESRVTAATSGEKRAGIGATIGLDFQSIDGVPTATLPASSDAPDGRETYVRCVLQLHSEGLHPVFGAGLLIGLELMLNLEDKARLHLLGEELKLSEAAPIHTPYLLFGAWCEGRVPGSRARSRSSRLPQRSR